MEIPTRTFRIVEVISSNKKVKSDDHIGRRFTRSPAAAAAKAGTRICAESGIRGDCQMVITIVETTRDSKHKEYSYEIKREKMDKVVSRGGKEIVFKFATRARSLNR